jgi:hypothetical protein
LFKSYGDKWFQQRQCKFGLIPLKNDYPQAEQLLRTLRQLENECDLSIQARLDLYSIISNMQLESRTINALPRDYMHVDTIVENSMRFWHEQNASRPLEELQETGHCVDTIRHGKSALPFAGHGAFATRDILNGEIVMGLPLIHVPSMEMAIIQDDNTTTTDNQTYYHLWVNYCMGHGDGKILLCPYGVGVNYINHNHMRANIRLQWAPNRILLHTRVMTCGCGSHFGI